MANLAPSNLAFMNFAAALPALPGLFQLYTYGECLPTLVDMLRGDRKRIRRVILMGTTVPLLMYTAWLFVALAQNGSWASNADLAQSMLESGGVLGAATASVAIAASISTLIGGYLALVSDLARRAEEENSGALQVCNFAHPFTFAVLCL